MKSNDIKNLTTEEIQSKILEIKEELFTLRFQLATGNLENPTKIREYRRTIARMKTIISERQNEAK